ncbi:MAG: MFS transporter [Limnochordaceae bacterium]|nr:MFS transporter [Limnochordaceae bacterium]
MLERTGKGIRTPSRDVLLSYATQTVGRGYGFGLHEALDQIGAIAGPLVVASAAFAGEGYRTGFAWLAVPAVVALAVLAGARIFYPAPQALESEQSDGGQQAPASSQTQRRRPASATAGTLASGTAAPSDFASAASSGTTTAGVSDSANNTGTANTGTDEPGQASAEPVRFGRALWLYIAFSSLAVLGFANFQLLSYHFKAAHLMADAWIPVAFAVAMAVDAAAALVVGKLYDRVGLRVLLALPLGTLLAVLLVFSFRPLLAWAGVLVWGIVMGVQETIMRAAIADLSPLAIRGRAYGVFNTAFGVAWFAGSAIMGALYDISVVGVVAFATAAQLLALPIFVILRRQVGRPASDRGAV